MEEFENAIFYVIRSKKSDDIHKAVKYGVWTSSAQNNIKIEKSFINKNAQSGNVFFVFTHLNATGFIGLARLASVDLNLEFPFWGEIGKWIGVMQIEWVYLRDVEFCDIVHLRESHNDLGERYMSDMTDGSRLGNINAKKIIGLMNNETLISNIVKKFPGLDLKEKKNRLTIEEIIRTNMMEIYKKRGQQKIEEPRIQIEEKEEEESEVVIPRKKMTQAEIKKLKKQNSGNPENK